MKTLKCLFLCLLIFFSASNIAYAATTETVADKIELTDAEKQFIAEHPVIHLGVDPNFVPYEFIDSDNTYKGIAADYIDLICQRTGLAMSVTMNLTWAEAYTKAVEKELDVLPCVSKTKEREQYFLFSNSYYTFQRVIFINQNNKNIKTLDDLKGDRVAVQTNSSHHSYLMANDSLELSLYNSVEEALQAVSDGREIAFVGNLSTSIYLAKSLGITNLKYITIDTEEPQKLYFAVRNDWPQLVGIINKALASIDEEEKIAINNKWIGIEETFDYAKIIKIICIFGIVVVIIFTVSLFWINRLKKEIEKRKKTQEELKIAKEEAGQANQIKSLFLARMSHEIRTPLNAIMGMSYLIKKTDINVTQEIYLDKLTQAARNMLSIINDILDFSKIEAGKLEIERISFDLDKVLQRVTNIISIKVEEQGIDFSIEKSPDTPVFFMGDPVRIEQILLNIVNNAVKFTEKGLVLLSVHSIRKEDHKYVIEFCVKDTGIGMTKEQADRLFIPFDQGESSINRRFGGTGLGLSIVKNLTDLMGGEIEVHSVLNEGSTFYIRLPLEADTSKQSMSSKKMAADCFRNIRALVVDKSENTRAMLKECFSSFGIQADFASCEDEALLMMQKAKEDGSSYNLLLVDYLTPKDGGIEFINQIKNKSLFKENSKYILLLPMSREDLFTEIEASEIDFGISKPIIPSVLYNGIIEMFKINHPSKQELSSKQETLKTPYPYHILLVEDNKTNQFIAQSILSQAGFNVSKADNGEEGYNLFKDKQADLDMILMDIHMPVMDGYEASDLIRKINADIPIVAMTADAISGVEEKCKSHGMDHYVSKPFEPEQFIATILEVLGQTANIKESSSPEDCGGETVLDTADGIKRIGGDAQIYNLILQEYYEENKSTAANLREKINSRDYAEAIQIVHKIKSSSGSIGAKGMYEAASELQKSLQNNEHDIPQKHERFQLILAKLLSEIKNMLQN